jgi:tetratricopeptide (TPR) repeat protein
MEPYRATRKSRSFITLLTLTLFLAFTSVTEVWADPPVTPANDPTTRRGFDHFYNMEYEKAIKDFENVAEKHPDDPFPNNYLLSAVLFKELYRVGALNSESYASDNFLSAKAKRPLDPNTQKRIKDLIARTETLTAERLAKNPNDTDALYARGVARGMRSTYMGMGEKAWLASVRSALAARRDHERVLELDPKYVDAKMIVGIHNYIIGSLNWAVRTAVTVVSVGGSKSKGLDYLRDVSKSNTVATTDAKIALALFLRREQKYTEAVELVRGMTEQYPHSFLMAQEYGDLLNAAGHGQEAISQYQSILESCKKKFYPLPEPEHAAYGLGVSARGQRQFQLAADAFDTAANTSGAESTMVDRANLAAGEMYDILQKRDIALKRYQAAAASNGESADEARKYIRQPYRGVR